MFIVNPLCDCNLVVAPLYLYSSLLWGALVTKMTLILLVHQHNTVNMIKLQIFTRLAKNIIFKNSHTCCIYVPMYAFQTFDLRETQQELQVVSVLPFQGTQLTEFYETMR